MSEAIEFERMSTARQFREDEGEWICPVDDDARTKTVHFTSDAPDHLLERARDAATAEAAEAEEDALEAIDLTDAERRDLDFSRDGVNVPKARYLKGLGAEYGLDPFQHVDPGEIDAVADARPILERARKTSGTGRGGGGAQYDDEATERERRERRKGADAAHDKECNHARKICKHGEPEACEFLTEACGYDPEEVAGLLGDTRHHGDEDGDGTEQKELVTVGGEGEYPEMDVTPAEAGALRKSWGGYKSAVRDLADAVETVREEVPNARRAWSAINAIRGDHDQTELHPDRLHDLLGALEGMPGDIPEVRTLEHYTDTGDSGAPDLAGHGAAADQPAFPRDPADGLEADARDEGVALEMHDGRLVGLPRSPGEFEVLHNDPRVVTYEAPDKATLTATAMRDGEVVVERDEGPSQTGNRHLAVRPSEAADMVREFAADHARRMGAGDSGAPDLAGHGAAADQPAFPRDPADGRDLSVGVWEHSQDENGHGYRRDAWKWDRGTLDGGPVILQVDRNGQGEGQVVAGYPDLLESEPLAVYGTADEAMHNALSWLRDHPDGADPRPRKDLEGWRGLSDEPAFPRDPADGLENVGAFGLADTGEFSREAREQVADVLEGLAATYAGWRVTDLPGDNPDSRRVARIYFDGRDAPEGLTPVKHAHLTIKTNDSGSRSYQVNAYATTGQRVRMDDRIANERILLDAADEVARFFEHAEGEGSGLFTRRRSDLAGWSEQADEPHLPRDLETEAVQSAAALNNGERVTVYARDTDTGATTRAGTGAVDWTHGDQFVLEGSHPQVMVALMDDRATVTRRYEDGSADVLGQFAGAADAPQKFDTRGPAFPRDLSGSSRSGGDSDPLERESQRTLGGGRTDPQATFSGVPDAPEGDAEHEQEAASEFGVDDRSNAGRGADSSTETEAQTLGEATGGFDAREAGQGGLDDYEEPEDGGGSGN